MALLSSLVFAGEPCSYSPRMSRVTLSDGTTSNEKFCKTASAKMLHKTELTRDFRRFTATFQRILRSRFDSTTAEGERIRSNFVPFEAERDRSKDLRCDCLTASVDCVVRGRS